MLKIIQGLTATWFALSVAITPAAASTATKVPAKVDVVIIGAGLSGLATAYALKKAHVPYHILELSPRIGGRVRTVQYHRPGEPMLYADSGMEEYWESNPAVKLLRELKLKTRSDVAASSIVLDNKLEELGDEDPQIFLKRILSVAEFKALENFKSKITPMVHQILEAHEAGKTPPANLMALKEQPFSSWVESQVPHRVAEWIRISIECEIGTGWDRLSALDGLAEMHIFLGKGEMSYRVLGGNEKFTNALAQASGIDHISLSKNVTRIVRKGDGSDVTYLDLSTNQSSVIHAKYVVSTIPLYRLFEVQFEPALSALKREAIASQTWGAYFKAHVFVKAKASHFWMRGTASILPILSDSELGVIYEGNPDQNTPTKIISLLVTGDAAEGFNMMNQDAIRARVEGAFDRLWPGFSKEILRVEFFRIHPRAIAGWPVGRSRYDALSDEIRRPENRVYLSGDFTEGTHSSGAFESAERVSREIIALEKKAK